ncbi:MAG: TlpA disulfide reductase family protein [Bacteroidota bacterium]
MKKNLRLAVFFVAFFSVSSLQVRAQFVKEDFSTFQKRLQQENDTLYVYNFWATWCRPCVAELPYFEQLRGEYENQKVKVVLVSLDFPEQVDRSLKPFLKKKKLQSEIVLLDALTEKGWIPTISPEWSGAIPATLLVRQSDSTYQFKEQDFEYEPLKEWVEGYL